MTVGSLQKLAVDGQKKGSLPEGLVGPTHAIQKILVLMTVSAFGEIPSTCGGVSPVELDLSALNQKV